MIKIFTIILCLYSFTVIGLLWKNPLTSFPIKNLSHDPQGMMGAGLALLIWYGVLIVLAALTILASLSLWGLFGGVTKVSIVLLAIAHALYILWIVFILISNTVSPAIEKKLQMNRVESWQKEVSFEQYGATTSNNPLPVQFTISNKAFGFDGAKNLGDILTEITDQAVVVVDDSLHKMVLGRIGWIPHNGDRTMESRIETLESFFGPCVGFDGNPEPCSTDLEGDWLPSQNPLTQIPDKNVHRASYPLGDKITASPIFNQGLYAHASVFRQYNSNLTWYVVSAPEYEYIYLIGISFSSDQPYLLPDDPTRKIESFRDLESWVSSIKILR